MTADECRKLASSYRALADDKGTSPRMASVLRNISKSFSGLANQYELLFAIAEEERR
jgi:hypothetical protein